jgi:uncharacterized protein
MRQVVRTRPRPIVFAPTLIIMAKRPRAGLVKQRLGQSIGDVAAIRLYRTCLAHTVLRLASSTRWRTLLAITPDADVAAPFWPPAAGSRRVRLLPQGEGDLGKRMQRIFHRLSPGPAIIVGSDVPAIRCIHIAKAFQLLGRASAVFGPAQDGGYWLVGLRRTPRVLSPFARVRWSSPHTLTDTLANCKRRRVAFAAKLSDIDTAKDYRRSRRCAERFFPPRGEEMPAGETRLS